MAGVKRIFYPLRFYLITKHPSCRRCDLVAGISATAAWLFNQEVAKWGKSFKNANKQGTCFVELNWWPRSCVASPRCEDQWGPVLLHCCSCCVLRVLRLLSSKPNWGRFRHKLLSCALYYPTLRQAHICFDKCKYKYKYKCKYNCKYKYKYRPVQLQTVVLFIYLFWQMHENKCQLSGVISQTKQWWKRWKREI